MNIPEKFRKIINKDSYLNGIIETAQSNYGSISKENNLYFFEEYTDHGISHIESVLNTSINIIPKESLKLLKSDANSISVYILSTILHDIGMLITPDGFNCLISGQNDSIRIKELDHKTWKELWEEYLDEAKRFGDKEKVNILGNISWDFKIPEIEFKDKLTGEDKKLIGEFIRRHHPRIAHEIALKGFPSKNGYFPFAENLQPALKDLCGLIARSHGINIRDIFEYLECKYPNTWAKPYGIHIIYLMVILRISDYFQTDASRLPLTLKLKTFNSPYSQIEHFKHEDVKFLQPHDRDPETLIFHCQPRNSSIFIKLKELFKDIQKELDISWAILGEVYGKEAKENQPQILYRRIKSNIDDVVSFSKNINYIPEKINFKISDELSKLLIGPLYGNDPTYGVRELLQNALDACREREFLEEGYQGEITITLDSEDGNYYFKIEDNGIGMDLTVIKNYFLEIGSSLRRSSFWRKNFTDEDGSSKIQRSGKFGIGVLASFLIGDKINVETRTLSLDYGLYLSTDLNTEQIEISKTNKNKIGTIITIPIDKKILERFKKSKYPFDKWYRQENPKVMYIDNTKSFRNLNSIVKAPGYSDELNNAWRILESKDYNKIIWTYNDEFYDKNKEKVICNTRSKIF